MTPLALAVLLTLGQVEKSPQVEISPHPTQYQPVTLTFVGPATDETALVNPYRDYRFDLELKDWATETEIVVPGYFAADGNAAQTGATAGRKWRAQFLPESAGEWTYRVRFMMGADVALPTSGTEAKEDPKIDAQSLAPNGLEGSFVVAEAQPKAFGFYRIGPVRGTPISLCVLFDGGAMTRLTSAGEKRYQRFAGTNRPFPNLSGRPFLKAGTDSPENLLAYADFDGTKALGGPEKKRDGESSRKGLHTYSPHVGDWKEGDPTWGDGQGKGLIGALNYLASQGVNSMYFLPMNVAGDGKDVWPWVDENTRDRFDVSKLAQWEIVFTHADRLGIALHIVLAETENESLFEALDGNGEPEASATRDQAKSSIPFADTRKLYYRELVARFAHHSAIVWNLGEENGGGDDRFGKGNTTEQRKAYASYLRSIDAYAHPIVVHTFPNQYDKIYEPLLGFDAIDGPSLQMGAPQKSHAETLKWVKRSREAGRPWFVCIDEIGPADTGVVPDDAPNAAENHKIAREVLWGNLLAGGSGVEWYFGYKYAHNDLNCEDFRSREKVWKFTKAAIDFFHEHLPFEEMESADDLVHSDGAFGFAKSGEVYAAYLPSAAKPVEMDLSQGEFEILWFDPINGGELQTGDAESVTGKARASLGSPPKTPDQDWVVLVQKRSPATSN